MSEPRRCKALRDYVAKTDDELTFKEGDVIFVPRKAPGDRWQGVFAGKVGWFPKIYVQDTTVEIKEPGQTTRVKAIRAHEATNEKELSFPAGCVMFVIGKDGDYWKGVYQGKSGLIPMANVQDATDTATLKRKKEKTGEAEAAPAGPAPVKCKAIRTFVAQNIENLSFKLGDTVFVPVPDPAQEFWRGVSNNAVGTFPKEYVVEIGKKTDEEIKAMIAEREGSEEEKTLQAQLLDERAANAAKLAALEREQKESGAAPSE